MRARTAIALILVFGSLPFAAASNELKAEGGDVSGRAILFDLTQFDPNLAAVAGQAKAQVSWLGGAITFDRADRGWIYAVPAGSDDPTEKALTPTGTWYNFTDDNGATWMVQEWTYIDAHTAQYRLGDQIATEHYGFLVHVWTVRTSAETYTDELLGLDYNFVVVVDTAKLLLIGVDERGQPTGIPMVGDGAREGDVDLHFTRGDPADQCRVCR